MHLFGLFIVLVWLVIRFVPAVTIQIMVFPRSPRAGGWFSASATECVENSSEGPSAAHSAGATELKHICFWKLFAHSCPGWTLFCRELNDAAIFMVVAEHKQLGAEDFQVSYLSYC